MKMYRTDWKIITFVIGAGLALWILDLYMQESQGAAFSHYAFWKANLIAVIPMAFGVLLATRYSYASIYDHTLKFVYLFFYRRTIDIRDITEINDQPTYKVAKSSFRSIYVFYETRERGIQYIELRVTIFPERTLGELIKELKRINPNIKVNGYCAKLAQSA